MPGCFSGRNDPDDAVFVKMTVADHEQSEAGTETKQNKPILACRMFRIVDQTGMVVIKHRLRFIEANPVLSRV